VSARRSTRLSVSCMAVVLTVTLGLSSAATGKSVRSATAVSGAVATGQTTAPTEEGTLVQTLRLSQLDPPSPDPAGITYFPGTDRLDVSDSEVEEMKVFEGANLFELTRKGSLKRTGVTTAYSNEPTGLGFNPADRILFVSSDDQRRVFLVRPGPNGRFGTSDDRVVDSIDVSKFKSPVDAEGVEYDSKSGHVFIIDGEGREVWRIKPGRNGTFGDRNDKVSHFDVGKFGAEDPEGIGLVAFRDNLVIIDDDSESAYEVTKGGALVRTIDLSDVPGRSLAGITLAPGTNDPKQLNLWVADGGVDNADDPKENDGRIFEISWPSAPPILTTLNKRITESSGDAEETRSTGAVKTKQAGLDLIRTRSGRRQMVGLRFDEVRVPSGATVVNAYLQFHARRKSSGKTSLTIWAEDSDNARRFARKSFNVSSRARTAASVEWSPPTWKVKGQSSAKQRTPDLTSVLQEIFSRSAWARENALALIIAGSGRRVVEAFDGRRAPVLHIEFAKT
jgi:hypothetical protein